MKSGKLMTCVAIAAIAAMNVTSYATASGNAFNSAEKQQIETVVHDYLLKNPDVVVQSLQLFQEKQMNQARETIQKTQTNSPKFANALFHEGKDPMAGNANGKITVVEFFDYQCSHCIDMAPILQDLIKNNPNVKIVFKEFPIRGPISDYAAKVALAANEQGKYAAFHDALMLLAAKQQPLTQDAVLGVAKNVGLDMDKVKAALASDAIKQQLKANYKLAQDLQLMGTPAFFVAKSDVTPNAPSSAIIFVPGQLTKDQLEQVINKVSQ